MTRLLAIFTVIGLAAALALGRTLDLHNADSLIPVFVSLDGWLPFYWGQDRFGMLLPLLVLPIRSSLWNLVAQNTIGIALFCAGACSVAGRAGTPVPLVVGAGLLLSMLWWPAEDVVLLLLTSNQSYGPALGLHGIGLALVTPHSGLAQRLAAWALIALGTWTNGGVGLLAASVVLVASALPSLRSDALRMLPPVMGSVLLHVALQRLTPGVRLDVSHVDMPSAAMLASRFVDFASDAHRRVVGAGLLPIVLAVVGICMAKRRERTVWQWTVAAVIGSCVYGLAMVALFGGIGRHFAPALPVMMAAILVAVARDIPARPAVAATALLVAVVAASSGVRSPKAGRQQLAERLTAGNTTELFRDRPDVITGEYWYAWPYAFGLNLLHEQVEGTRRVLPMALRAEDFFVPRAQRLPEGTRIAVVPTGWYLYWEVHGPKRPLRVLKVTGDYEIAELSAAPER